MKDPNNEENDEYIIKLLNFVNDKTSVDNFIKDINVKKERLPLPTNISLTEEDYNKLIKRREEIYERKKIIKQLPELFRARKFLGCGKCEYSRRLDCVCNMKPVKAGKLIRYTSLSRDNIKDLYRQNKKCVYFEEYEYYRRS